MVVFHGRWGTVRGMLLGVLVDFVAEVFQEVRLLTSRLRSSDSEFSDCEFTTHDERK
jgi:hypothetical protein